MKMFLRVHLGRLDQKKGEIKEGRKEAKETRVKYKTRTTHDKTMKISFYFPYVLKCLL